MVMIRIYEKISDDLIAELKIVDRLTLIIGDSGTGKSHICDMLVKTVSNPYYYKIEDTNKKCKDIIVCSNKDDYIRNLTDDSKDYSVLLLDEYGANELRSDKDRKNLILKYYKYTVLILREGINSFNVGLHSIKELGYRDNVYKLEDDILKKVELSDDELRSKNCIITEDSKSAYQYFKYYFGESKLIVDYAKKDEKDLTGVMVTLLNKIEQGKNIVGLIDYDMGGGIIYNIKENYINEYRNVTFIAAECFEQMILYHAMIYDKLNENEKDMVENFYNYISCDYKHRGLYFLELC